MWLIEQINIDHMLKKYFLALFVIINIASPIKACLANWIMSQINHSTEAIFYRLGPKLCLIFVFNCAEQWVNMPPKTPSGMIKRIFDLSAHNERVTSNFCDYTALFHWVGDLAHLWLYTPFKRIFIFGNHLFRPVLQKLLRIHKLDELITLTLAMIKWMKLG